MAAAADRQRKITVTRRSNGYLDVFSVAAMDDGARHGTDGFCPDSGCGGVAVIAGQRHPVGQLSAETAESSLDQIGHGLLSGSAAQARVWRAV